jgi:hypothetical protein
MFGVEGVIPEPDPTVLGAFLVPHVDFAGALHVETLPAPLVQDHSYLCVEVFEVTTEALPAAQRFEDGVTPVKTPSAVPQVD